MSPTARQLNRAALQRQLLLRREPLEVTDAVGRLLALQAQEAASPYLALWNRLAGFDPADLDAGFAAGALVKAPLMRLTLHAVRAGDYPLLHSAMLRSLRASRFGDRRFLTSGASVEQVDGALAGALAFLAEPRTGAQVEQALRPRLGEHAERAWWAMRTFAPVHRAPTGGPWAFGSVAYVAAAAGGCEEAAARGVRELLVRYLAAFGPATAQDFAQFTMLRSTAVKPAVAALGDALVTLPGPGRAPLLDLPGTALPDPDTPAPPRLLGMWDNLLLAYADRGRVLPDAYRAAVLRRNGDVLPTLLVDGHVAGVWRPVEGGIEATAFHDLDERDWAGLAAEAAALLALLADRDTAVYRRYGHWWDKGLPAAQVRVLGG
jgi:hypothetical protein